MSEERIVYGANCAWWDSISKASRTITAYDVGLPCCPHCRGVLFEAPNERAWWGGVDDHEGRGHPNYRRFIEWIRGKCFPNYEVALEKFKTETGVEVG